MKFGPSFYRNDFSGLGADDAALSFADQALVALVSPQPSLLYTEWATQASDGSWTEALPTKDYQAYAVSDFQLVAVANTTSAEVETLAVISPVLTRASTVTTAFEGTPFAYDHTEAIYAQLDTAATPQIYFCYWLRLRDRTDPKTGPTSLNYAATSVMGVLAYILEVPPPATDRAHPAAGSFNGALAAQAAKAPITVPATPAVQTTVPAVPGVSTSAPPTALPSAPTLPATSAQQAAITQQSNQNLKSLLWVGLGACVVVGGYKYYQSRRTG